MMVTAHDHTGTILITKGTIPIIGPTEIIRAHVGVPGFQGLLIQDLVAALTGLQEEAGEEVTDGIINRHPTQ